MSSGSTSSSSSSMPPPPLQPPAHRRPLLITGEPQQCWDLVSTQSSQQNSNNSNNSYYQEDLRLSVIPASQRGVVYNRSRRQFALLPPAQRHQQQGFCPLCRRGGPHPDQTARAAPDQARDHQQYRQSPEAPPQADHDDDDDAAHFEEIPDTPEMAPFGRKRQHGIEAAPRVHRRLIPPPSDRVQPRSLFKPPQESHAYFELLSDSVQGSPSSSPPHTPLPPGQEDHSDQDRHLDPNSFVQGYYDRFFIEQRKLGRGARGVVYQCEHVLEGTPLGMFAVKKVSVGDSAQSLVTTLREVKYLERLRHPSIISYHHSWMERVSTTAFQPSIPHLFLLMSYANGGSLHAFINQRRNAHSSPKSSFSDGQGGGTDVREKLKQAFRKKQRHAGGDQLSAIHHLRVDEILSLFSGIAEGLEFLHAHMVLHLDLKAENVLLEYDQDDPEHFGMPRPVLSDFGSSEARNRLLHRERTGYTGTLDYVAPEALQVNRATGRFRELDAACDLWSLGLLLHLLCYLRLPFSKEDLSELRDEILSYPGFKMTQQGRGDLPLSLLHILGALVHREPAARPSASDVLRTLHTSNMTPLDGEKAALVPKSWTPPAQSEGSSSPQTPSTVVVEVPLTGRSLWDALFPRSLYVASAFAKILSFQQHPIIPQASLVVGAAFAEAISSNHRISLLSLLVYWIVVLVDPKTPYHLQDSFLSLSTVTVLNVAASTSPYW